MPVTLLNTLFFKAQGSAGWTESWFCTSASIEVGLANLGNVAKARLDLLARGNFLPEFRVSDVDVFRDSLIDTFNDAQSEGKYAGPGGTTAGNNEQAWDRLLLRMESGATARRSYEMGGIPRGIINQRGAVTNVETWNLNRDAWYEALFNAAGPIQLKRYGALSENWPIIAAVAGANAYELKITVSTAAQTDMALAPGLIVRIGQSKGYGNYQGLWKVQTGPTAVPAGQDFVLAARRYLPSFPLAGSGKLGTVCRMINAPIYTAVTKISPLRGVRRKTGGPFDLSHGITRSRED